MSHSVSLATKGIICPGTPTVAIATRGVICVPVFIEEIPVVDRPLSYVHITDLIKGDQVKINIQPIYRFTPRVTKNGVSLKLGKGRALRGYEKATLTGTIISNNTTSGSLALQVSYNIFKKHARATIPYRTIDTIQKIVEDPGMVETANIHKPGQKALGTHLIGGTLSTPRYFYIPVRF